MRAIFSSGSVCAAGCMVAEGKLVKGCGVRVVHKGKTVYVGKLDSLRRVKEVVKEVTERFPLEFFPSELIDHITCVSILLFVQERKFRI